MENKENEAQEIEAIKKVATEFFYWWYNQKGSNTEQGFDEWAKTVDGQSALTASQNEVELLRADVLRLEKEVVDWEYEVKALKAKIFTWIPVSERLPENGENVLACRTLINGERTIQKAFQYSGKWELSWDGASFSNVTHWMKLPEPPKPTLL
jgi:hypothetical protein